MRDKVGVWSINATTESALSVPRLADLCHTGLHVHKTRREATAAGSLTKKSPNPIWGLVCCWHFSDLPTTLTNVGYREKSGSNSDIANAIDPIRKSGLTQTAYCRDALWGVTGLIATYSSPLELGFVAIFVRVRCKTDP